MVRAIAVGLFSLYAACGTALAQDMATTGPQAAGALQGGSVQVGAGSKGDVTPGESGPQTASGRGIDPAPVTFNIRPPASPFYGPERLPINPPRRLRCEIIQDPSAGRSCEARAARLGGG